MKAKNGNSLSACAGAYVVRARDGWGRETRSGEEEEKRRGSSDIWSDTVLKGRKPLNKLYI